MAAIGIKGTDFVVKTDVNNTLASVYTGAIMLTPLASGCQASFGPCQNGSEKLLTEDMKGQMLTLSRLQVIPQLVPSVDLLAQRARPLATDFVAKSEQGLKGEGSRPEVANEKTVASESRAVDIVTIGKSTSAILPMAPVAAVDISKLDAAPEVRQLVWARLAAVAADHDTISRSFAVAMQNNRQSTVGNVAFSLFRESASTGPAILSSAETSANFRLAGGTAQLTRLEGGIETVEAARVGSGTLNVDFARSTFATQLTVTNARIGAESVVSNGVVQSDGIFRAQGGNAFTAGALSLDGKEAGYFFAKPVAVGELTGITQWGR